MIHWQARRRLTALLDDDLTTDEARHVRAHVDRCRRCLRRLRELEAADVLMRRMPRSLVPEQWSLSVELRLRAVAGIQPTPPTAVADAMAFRTAAAAVSMAIVLALVTIGPLSPQHTDRASWTGILASAERESTILAYRYEPNGGFGRN